MRKAEDTKVRIGAELGAPSAEWRLPRLDEIPSFVPWGSAFWQRGICWVFLIAGLAFYLIPSGRQTPLEELATTLKTFLLMGGSSAALLLLIHRASSERTAGLSLRSVKTKLPVESACPVKIKILQAETITGSDEGYLWLDEDTLFFKGTQCAFRVNANDLSPLEQWHRSHQPKSQSGLGLRWLELNHGRRSLWIHFSFLELDNDHACHKRAAQLVRSLMEWMTNRPQGVMESVLPPLDVHPGLIAAGRWSSEGWITGLMIGFFGAAVTFASVLRLASPGHLGVSATEGLVAFLGLAMTFYGVRFASLQLRDKGVRRAISLEQELSLPMA